MLILNIFLVICGISVWIVFFDFRFSKFKFFWFGVYKLDFFVFIVILFYFIIDLINVFFFKLRIFFFFFVYDDYLVCVMRYCMDFGEFFIVSVFEL